MKPFIHPWTRSRAQQRFQYGLGSAAGLAGAALVLIMTCFVAMAARTNVLETAAHTTPVQTAPGDVGPPEILL